MICFGYGEFIEVFTVKICSYKQNDDHERCNTIIFTSNKFLHTFYSHYFIF